MANLKCPLCGRRVNLAGFDSSDYDLDICCVEVKGLGRGRVFEETSRYSIVYPGNATVELLNDRILELVNMLLENGCLEQHEILKSLNIEPIDPEEFHMGQLRVEALKGKLQDAVHEKDKWKSEAEALEASLERK